MLFCDKQRATEVHRECVSEFVCEQREAVSSVVFYLNFLTVLKKNLQYLSVLDSSIYDPTLCRPVGTDNAFSNASCQ